MIWYEIINPSFMRKEKRNREKKLFWWKKQILATVAPRQITLERFNLRTTGIPMCPCFCPQLFALFFWPHFCSVRHCFNLWLPIFIMRIMISIYLFGRSPHMGQFVQGGKNGRLMSFFFKVEPPCDQTWWDSLVFSILSCFSYVLDAKNTLVGHVGPF